MSDRGEEMVRRLAAEVERYIEQHPGAADTADGIRAWWLAPELKTVPIASVVAALESLIARDLMMKTELEGARVIYSSVRRLQ